MRVLLIVHGFPPWAMGGTEIYTHDLASALAQAGDTVFVLTREADPQLPEYHVRTEDRNGVHLTIVNYTFRTTRSFAESYCNPAIRQVGAELFDRVRPDLVHIQHLTNLSTGLVFEIAARGIPCLFTLHDYWLICHRGQFFDLDLHRCDPPLPMSCSRCIGSAEALGAQGYRAARTVRSIEQWMHPNASRWLRRIAAAGVNIARGRTGAVSEAAARTRHMQKVSMAIGHFLAPSETLRRRFLAFGIEDERMTPHQLGIDQNRFGSIPRTASSKLRIGFFGSLIVPKAPHLVVEAFDRLRSEAATLHVFGSCAAYHGDDRYRDQLSGAFQRARPGFQHIGPVSHEQVPLALASVDVIVVPSVWIENAPLIIREAFAAGVPVVASRLGGMEEMVQHECNGLLFEPGNAGDLAVALTRLIEDPELLSRLRAGISKPLTIAQDVAATRAAYTKLLNRG